MKVNIVPIQSYGSIQGITGIQSDVCLCAPHVSQTRINKHNKNKGRGNTSREYDDVKCTRRLHSSVQKQLKLGSAQHRAPCGAAGKWLGPYTTDNKPQAL